MTGRIPGVTRQAKQALPLLMGSLIEIATLAKSDNDAHIRSVLASTEVLTRGKYSGPAITRLVLGSLSAVSEARISKSASGKPVGDSMDCYQLKESSALPRCRWIMAIHVQSISS